MLPTRKRLLRLTVGLGLAAAGIFGFYELDLSDDAFLRPPDRLPDHSFIGPEIPDQYRLERIEDVFPSNSTLQDVLSDHQFSPAQIHQLVLDTRDVYNLDRVTAGNRFVLERDAKGDFRSLQYEISSEELLVVKLVDDQYVAVRQKLALDEDVAEIFGRIQDNFYNALVSKGEQPSLIESLVGILQWDIDFTAIQEGDSFKLIFVKKSYHDNFVGYGDVLAAEFRSGGKTFYAFQFEDPESSKKRYFGYDGKAVKKAFLRVPFNYDYRISSGFSYSRLHPVSRVRRPHLGVDYAAPYGTPVLASGSGRVVFAGRKGANGNMVVLRHPNGYRTYYLHLSKILVRAGESVSQGQRIGRVGATGLVTAAHLDYRIQRPNGKFLNPKQFVALPSEEAISKADWSEFVAVRDAFLERLNAIPEEETQTDRRSVAGD